MTSIELEELRRLRERVKARGEQIARRKQEIEVLRRVTWLRMDLLRRDGILGPPRAEADPRHAPHVPLYPPALAGAPGAGADGTAHVPGTGQAAAHVELAPAR